MTDHLKLRPHSVLREDRADGAIILKSAYTLSQPVRTTSDWLARWAIEAPDRVAFAERSGAGWRSVSYATLLDQVRAVAAGLLDRAPSGPILILSGNSLDHAILSLAAHHVGIATVPVAEQYSLIPAAHSRLKYVVDLVQPGLVFASDADAYAAAIEIAGVPAICTDPKASNATRFSSLLTCSGDVSSAHAEVGPETVAKLLMTSGSTSDPKGVVTTQRMMTTNQAQVSDALPFLADHPPVLVDWLPWNHVFGSSYNFNLVLAHGGSLYIDDGKPLPAQFARTLENLGMQSGTISFNVPVGFAQLVEALGKDKDLRRTYFSDLDMIFYAGASLSQDTWSALEDLAIEELGRLPLITSSWGLTETAPGALLQHEPAKGAGIVGVPMPGISVKLIDDGTGRMDVRVAGDNVFDTYLRDPDKTSQAFDEDGFFITGDAMRFVDPDDMSKGLKFDGRLGEDFKLNTGTWVQAGNMRSDVLSMMAPFAADVVICGEARDCVGALIIPNRAAIESADHELHDDGPVCLAPSLFKELRHRMREQAAAMPGSAKHITRAVILSEPPSMGDGEMTAKGNLNFSRILERRADVVTRLFSESDPAVITI